MSGMIWERPDGERLVSIQSGPTEYLLYTPNDARSLVARVLGAIAVIEGPVVASASGARCDGGERQGSS